MAGRVAGRRDDHDAGVGEPAQRVHVRLAAGAGAAQAHADDLGGVRIGRQAEARQLARQVETGGPQHADQDFGVEPTPLSEHTHRQHVDVAGGAGDADVVVVGRSDQAERLRAVPGGTRRVAARKDRILLVVRVDPVARIARVGVSPVAVVRRRKVAAAQAVGVRIVGRHQVVAGKDIAALQVGMVPANAGVEHGDDDDGAVAGTDVPGLLGIDCRRRGVGRGAVGRGRLQVPLADRRAAGDRGRWPGGVERVVGDAQEVPALVGHGVLDVGLSGELGREGGRAEALGENHVGPVGDTRAGCERDADPLAERLRLQGTPAGGRHRLLLHHLGVGPVLDDHAGGAGLGRGWPDALRHRRLGGQRQQHRGGERGNALVQSSCDVEYSAFLSLHHCATLAPLELDGLEGLLGPTQPVDGRVAGRRVVAP